MPEHIAIVMDGNGRWARERNLPRMAGHRKGVEVIWPIIETCILEKISYLTLFAFSSENWRRPNDEITFLMRLFVNALKKELPRLQAQGIRLHIIGALEAFSHKIQKLVRHAEIVTANNRNLTLTIALNYGGRWDIVHAVQSALRAQPKETNVHTVQFDETLLSQYLAMSYAPEPDLFIRTGGEQRISNFLLWQLAYTELYFTQTYWPNFDTKSFQLALRAYQSRERRFGRTSCQMHALKNLLPTIVDTIDVQVV